MQISCKSPGLELLPWIDESIGKHQKFLERTETAEEFYRKEKEADKERLRAEGVQRQAEQTARKMIARGRASNEEIAEDTGLSARAFARNLTI